MAEKTAGQTDPNPLDTWRQFITDSERQWNGFFKEVLGTDRLLELDEHRVEASLTVQRMVADNLERYYTHVQHPDAQRPGGPRRADEGDRGHARAPRVRAHRVERRRSAAVVRRRAPKPTRTKRPAVAAARSNGTQVA